MHLFDLDDDLLLEILIQLASLHDASHCSQLQVVQSFVACFGTCKTLARLRNDNFLWYTLFRSFYPIVAKFSPYLDHWHHSPIGIQRTSTGIGNASPSKKHQKTINWRRRFIRTFLSTESFRCIPGGGNDSVGHSGHAQQQQHHHPHHHHHGPHLLLSLDEIQRHIKHKSTQLGLPLTPHHQRRPHFESQSMSDDWVITLLNVVPSASFELSVSYPPLLGITVLAHTTSPPVQGYCHVLIFDYCSLDIASSFASIRKRPLELVSHAVFPIRNGWILLSHINARDRCFTVGNLSDFNTWNVIGVYPFVEETAVNLQGNGNALPTSSVGPVGGGTLDNAAFGTPGNATTSPSQPNASSPTSPASNTPSQRLSTHINYMLPDNLSLHRVLALPQPSNTPFASIADSFAPIMVLGTQSKNGMILFYAPPATISPPFTISSSTHSNTPSQFLQTSPIFKCELGPVRAIAEGYPYTSNCVITSHADNAISVWKFDNVWDKLDQIPTGSSGSQSSQERAKYPLPLPCTQIARMDAHKGRIIGMAFYDPVDAIAESWDDNSGSENDVEEEEEDDMRDATSPMNMKKRQCGMWRRGRRILVSIGDAISRPASRNGGDALNVHLNTQDQGQDPMEIDDPIDNEAVPPQEEDDDDDPLQDSGLYEVIVWDLEDVISGVGGTPKMICQYQIAVRSLEWYITPNAEREQRPSTTQYEPVVSFYILGSMLFLITSNGQLIVTELGTGREWYRCKITHSDTSVEEEDNAMSFWDIRWVGAGQREMMKQRLQNLHLQQAESITECSLNEQNDTLSRQKGLEHGEIVVMNSEGIWSIQGVNHLNSITRCAGEEEIDDVMVTACSYISQVSTEPSVE